LLKGIQIQEDSKMAEFTRKMIVFFVLALPVFFVQTANAAEPNFIEVDQFMHVLAEQQIQIPDGTTEIVSLRGTATIHVIFEGSKEGMADDDDGNRLDEVDANMVELNLSGMSSFGPVHMRLSAASPSLGRMEEIRNVKEGLLEVPPFGEGFVDSFFDLHFELNLAGQHLHGEGPIRCIGRLSHKPPAPGDVYENQTQIRLLDHLGQWSGARIGPGRFRLNPIVELDVFETAMCMLDLIMPDGSTLNIPMFGRSTENVFFEGDVEGSAFDDDGNLLDEVKTEMVELNLRGYHSDLGPVNMQLNTNLSSTGQMEERTDYNTGLLDVPPFFKAGMVESFFDIYFELELPVQGLTLHNQSPLRWQGVLSHKPAEPMDIYESLADVQLLDEDGNPTIFFISATLYRPNPVVEVDYTDTSIGSVDIITPSGGSYRVELAGSSTSRVFFEGDFEGSAYDDDRDGHDEVHIEMVALQLTGSDPEIGPVILRSDPCALSIGLIEEQTDVKTGRLDLPPFSNPCYRAGSFIDVHFEIEFAGMVMHGERPMHLSGVLNHKPAAPGDIYENLEDIRLVDANGVVTDYFLGAAFYEPTACGDALHPYPPGDANRDCRVNLLDVAIVGLHWLECTRPDCN
jgi:hypothetical protein